MNTTMTPEQCQPVVDEINAWLARSVGFAWSGRTVDKVERFTHATLEIYEAVIYRCRFEYSVGTRYKTVSLFFVREGDGELHLATQETTVGRDLSPAERSSRVRAK